MCRSEVLSSSRYNLLELKTSNSLVIDHLNQAASVLGSGNISVLFAGRRRRRAAADHSDVDCILRVVLAALADLELNLPTPSTSHRTTKSHPRPFPSPPQQTAFEQRWLRTTLLHSIWHSLHSQTPTPVFRLKQL